MVMHGGMTASLMDILGSWSILLVDIIHYSVSNDLSITFMSPGKHNDSIILVTKIKFLKLYYLTIFRKLHAINWGEL
jgi:acyl-coenzyme A thioesterase PaaI-like protein